MNRTFKNRIEALERQIAGPRIFYVSADDPAPEMRPGDVLIVDDIVGGPREQDTQNPARPSGAGTAARPSPCVRPN